MSQTDYKNAKIALTINNGSSSSKLALIAEGVADPLIAFNCANIGEEVSNIGYSIGDKDVEIELPLPDHKTAMRKSWEIIEENFPGIKIIAVGHRMVHGGSEFKESTLITNEVVEAIKKCSPLAPLHNPANLDGYFVASEIFPGVPHVAVFDTAFHARMPEHAKRYAVPNRWHDEDMVAKYGFHGTSFQFISRKFGAIKGLSHDELNLVIAHIGNGASISKVQGGISVDTSMGLTPLDGCVMGTRSGNIDAGVIEYICNKHQISAKEVIRILNKESGLKGMAGTNNMFLVWTAMKEGDKEAAIAFEVAAYRTAMICAGFLATMEGPKAIVFTAGVGENNGDYRRLVLSYMKFFNFAINEDTINKRGEIVQVGNSPYGIEAWVIPTNEELILGEDSIAVALTGHAPEKYSFEK